MVEFTPGTIEKLVELLRPPEPEVLQGEDLAPSAYEISSTRNKVPPSEEKKVPKNIEEFEEQEAAEAESLGQVGTGISGRKLPEYTMNYQQAVTAEDVFLQIGPKTPMSASCENLIVRIKMPGDKKENVDLSVDTTSVSVDSSRYSLKLPLPHAINPDQSKANWDTAEEMLVLTLKLDREFDFVNF
ncbi:dynein axonemal assembly factor 6 [Plodia interpunctella]|uniref:dynein axonemal assembly factor 6 n=1 Tax=Plodia interpunctella TaxID=58824 RepID=UPI00236767F5|nr:dynein axonemal assembly factor 6 [Plodia interpunctella]